MRINHSIIHKSFITICAFFIIFFSFSAPNFSGGPNNDPNGTVGQNKIEPVLDPAQGGQGTTVQVDVKITENVGPITSFGLDLGYDNTFFSYVGISKGALNADWASVDANEINGGTIRIGGYAGDGTAVPALSTGSIAALEFQVNCPSCTSGSTSQICLSNYVDDISTMTPCPSCTDFTFGGKDDFLGTWSGQGVYCRVSNTGAWVKLASPATKVDAGDLNDDGTDDLIGIWPTQGGVWAKYSGTGNWALLSSTADWIGQGDMNGDGRDDLIGSWTGQGVYYKNSSTGNWIKMASPATKVDAGDFDNDGTDDLAGIWPSQGGVWAKYSGTGKWELLSSTADWIGCGDMNGDSRDDLIGSWSGQGVYYKDSETGQWTKIASPASQVTAGDLDGDATDDLIGIWPGQGGVWVKYSDSGTWTQLSSTADWIAAGKMSNGESASSQAWLQLLSLDSSGGPGELADFEDFSATAPGGRDFVFTEQDNLVPGQGILLYKHGIPGPGDPGFTCIEQKNLIPRKEPLKKPAKKHSLR